MKERPVTLGIDDRQSTYQEGSMGKWNEAFNRSWLSRFLNSPAGRIFRVTAGVVFLVVGAIFWETLPGVLSMAWGVFPLTAGAFDICYISAALGGPLSGRKIRDVYHVN
jgi:hypothetical protein